MSKPISLLEHMFKTYSDLGVDAIRSVYNAFKPPDTRELTDEDFVRIWEEWASQTDSGNAGERNGA